MTNTNDLQVESLYSEQASEPRVPTQTTNRTPLSAYTSGGQTTQKRFHTETFAVVRSKPAPGYFYIFQVTFTRGLSSISGASKASTSTLDLDTAIAVTKTVAELARDYIEHDMFVPRTLTFERLCAIHNLFCLFTRDSTKVSIRVKTAVTEAMISKVFL